MYKLFASDLDGTFLNDEGKIPQKNREAVQYIQDQGIAFCFCSGRSHMSLYHFEKELDLLKKGGYGICYNGAAAYETDSRRIIFENALEYTLASRIIQQLRAYSANMIVYTKNMMYAEHETEELRLYCQKSLIPLRIIENFNQIEEPILKIVIKGTSNALFQVEKDFKEMWGSQCNIFLSSDDLLEFTAPKATKGYGILALAKRLEIQQEQIIAVGDHCNDVAMLKNAGMGIAVRNGVEKAKEAANVISATDNNDGVIWEIVQKYF